MNTNDCYLCNANKDQHHVFFQEGEGIFFKCERCGFVWLSKDNWPKNQEEYYSTEYYSEDYAGRTDLKKLFHYRFKILKKYCKPHGRILEVGAASGDFLSLLRDVGYEVEGVELSKRAAEQAERKYGLKLLQGTLEQASFPADHFDYIFMYHVLEHIPDPRSALREARRILKPGGRLIVEVPNVHSIDTYFSRQLLLNVLDYPNHLYAFTRSTLRSIFSEEGFSTVGLESGFPFILARLVTRAARFFTRPQVSSREQKNSPVVSGKEMLHGSAQDSYLKRTVQDFVPGMKITIVSEK